MNDKITTTTNKNRFVVAPNGSIDVNTNIQYGELCDLATDVTDFTKEVVTASLSDRAKDAFCGILNAVSKFFPNEFEHRRIAKHLDLQQEAHLKAMSKQQPKPKRKIPLAH